MTETSAEVDGRRPILGVARNVFYMGVVSLLADVSSEMVYPFVPFFLTTVLHVSAVPVGFIEGLAESTASLSTMFSGWFSDRIHRRKTLITGGYTVGVFSRPLVAFVASWPGVAALRFLDRIGKGVRTPPRDALIAESALPGERGRAFGVHRTMDTIGAILGPGIAAFVLYATTRTNYRLLFLLAGIPALAAVVVLVMGVRDARPDDHQPLPHLSVAVFSGRFKRFVIIATLFAVGNSSNVFLLLRAGDLGISSVGVAALYMVFNVVYALAATPAGMLSDKLGRRAVLVAGYVSFALVYTGFALATEAWMMWPLFLLYGAYPGLTEGVQRAFAADLAPARMRGSALGTFHFATGLAAFPASLIGGLLWHYVGPAATFWYGVGGASLAAILLVTVLPDERVAVD